MKLPVSDPWSGIRAPCSSRGEPITSRDNRFIREVRQALESGVCAALEGVHLVQEALEAGWSLQWVLIDAQRVETYPELGALLHKLPRERCVWVGERAIGAVQEARSSQGIVALLDPLQGVEVWPDSDATVEVWLDGLQDPGNVGTLLRTAAAAGVRCVRLSPGCARVWSPKVLRAGQGAQLRLAVFENCDLLRAARARPESQSLIVTRLDQAEDLHQTRLPRSAIWVFGHEGQGVSGPIMAQASQAIRIDHSARIESLNVASAAAVCLFEHRRQQPGAFDH